MTTARRQTSIRLLALVLLLLAMRGPATAHAETVGENQPILVFDQSTGQLLPLTPDTLAPRADAAIELGDQLSSWSVARSADGSTLVTLDPADPRAFFVRDGQTGAERTRIATELTIMNPILSADGARLLVRRDWYGGLSWALFDVASGRMISIFDCPEGWAEPVTVSPDLSRLYYLTIPSNTPLPEGPMVDHPKLIAIDLMTGLEIGRVLLPEIVSGASPVSGVETAGGETPYHLSTPGIAVSPDGATIAVIRADRSAFTVIHAASLTIERTESISHPESGLRRLLTWLSVLPRSAGAKMGTADVISAQFSPDATRLYIWGFHNEPDPERSREVSTGIGLIAVDVATGEVLAEGPAGQLIQRLVASTDGDSLYITGPSSGAALYSWVNDADVAAFASPHFLQRLDSDTLAVDVETEFSGPIWLAAPAGINGT